MAAAISGFVFFAFSPLALFAAEKPVTFRGQTIYVDGDPQQIWIGDKTSADAELVLLYTNYNAAVNSLRTEQKIETAQAVTDTKLDELTREVRAHNNFAQRVPVLEEQLRVANHRLSNLEKAHTPAGRAIS